MTFHRSIALAVMAIAFAMPAAAWAQEATIPSNDNGLSASPPTTLGGSGSGTKTTPATKKPAKAAAGTAAAPTASARLPRTGSDPRLLFALGIGIVLLGVGLRLRTADADLY